MSRLTRTTAALAVAVVAAGLTGCSVQERLGSAAVVDGHRITTSELQDATNGYLRLVPDADKSNAQLRILERMILSRVIDAEARTVGVHATPGEVAKERDDLLRSVGGRKGLVRQLAAGQSPVVLAPSYVDRWFRDRVLYLKIAKKLGGGAANTQQAAQRTTEQLIATGSSMDIEVNPRYGTWNPRRGVTPLVSGGLSQTAAQIGRGG